MRDVLVPVKDSNCSSNRDYGELLEPGTAVKVNGHYYFYSCPFGMMDLEGAWTSEESTSYSTYEFLCEVLNDGGCVELVLEG